MLILLILFVGALTLLELRFGHSLGREHLLNLTAWALQFGAALLLLPLVALAIPFSLIHGAALPFAVGFAIYLLAMDFGEWAFHRAQHAIPWLWAMHSLHHSDPDVTATTTQRHFWGDQLLKSVTIWPMADIAIRPTGPIILAYAVTSLWNFVAHARVPLNFGMFSWILNSPAYHRRHHSLLPEHHNSNFAALFPIWDVISGTYRRPYGYPQTGLESRPRTLLDVAVWPLRMTGAPIDIRTADRPTTEA